MFKDWQWENMYVYIKKTPLSVEIQMSFSIELDTAKLKETPHLLCPCILRLFHDKKGKVLMRVASIRIDI